MLIDPNALELLVMWLDLKSTVASLPLILHILTYLHKLKETMSTRWEGIKDGWAWFCPARICHVSNFCCSLRRKRKGQLGIWFGERSQPRLLEGHEPENSSSSRNPRNLDSVESASKCEGIVAPHSCPFYILLGELMGTRVVIFFIGLVRCKWPHDWPHHDKRGIKKGKK